MIKTIIFDFGGVVGMFDYRPVFEKLQPHTDLSPEEIIRAIDATDLEDAYESGRISSREFLIRLREICRLRCDDDLVGAAWSDIFWPNEPVCRLIPQLAQKYKLVLGSNTNALHATQYRRQFADTLRHFHDLVLSYEVRRCKPHQEFYQRCIERSGNAANECVFIDDLPANIAGAIACGMHGIEYTGFEQLQRQLTELNLL